MKFIGILLVIGTLASTGCASKATAKEVDPRTIDWKQKVGAPSYEQALADLDKPAVVTEPASGKTRRNGFEEESSHFARLRRRRRSFGSHSGVGVPGWRQAIVQATISTSR